MASLSFKRYLACTLLVSLSVLCGCAHDYLIKLKNGDQIVALSKPRLQDNKYHFTGSSGAQNVIARSRVAKIEAVTIVKEEEKASAPARFQGPKKPKHWYFLWLA